MDKHGMDTAAPAFPLHARQFICEPLYATEPSQPVFTVPPDFNTTFFGKGHAIHTHPLLPVIHEEEEDCEVVLLGYFLDPYHPDDDERPRLRRILKALKKELPLHLLHDLCGRFVLFIRRPSQAVVVSDACALRQLHYHADGSGRTWCFSQANLVSSHLALEEDPEAQYFRHHASALTAAYWWPGSSSLYRGVHRLLPNHYLQLEGGTVHRFWPDAGPMTLEYDAALERVQTLLEGTMAAALRRAPLALPLTAGLDSRLLLAAARPFAASLYVYTMAYASMKDDHEDLRVAQALAEAAGVDWKPLACPQGMDPHFEVQFFLHSVDAHPACGVLAQALYAHFPKDHWCVKGNVSEVGRCKYYLFGRALPARRISGALFATLHNMEGSAFAAAHFQEWIDSTLPLCERIGMVPTDLFHWELVLGSWQASSQLEWDMAMETLSPYNNRLLLETLLAVPDRYRQGPEWRFHRDLLQRMWPALLSLPFNPDQGRPEQRLKGSLHDLLRLFSSHYPGFYYPLKRLYRYFVKAPRTF